MYIHLDLINPLHGGGLFTFYGLTPTGGSRREFKTDMTVGNPTKDIFGNSYLGYVYRRLADHERRIYLDWPFKEDEDRGESLVVNLSTTLVVPGWNMPDIDVGHGLTDGTVVFKGTPEDLRRVFAANTNPYFNAYSKIAALTIVPVFPDGRPTQFERHCLECLYEL